MDSHEPRNRPLGQSLELGTCGVDEVTETLRDLDDTEVVIGPVPAWNSGVVKHAPATLSAIVPREDGSTHRGIY